MKDKVVFITGAAKGMGEATALMAARKGAKVVVADINVETANLVVDKIKAEGGEAIAVTCDVSSDSDVRNAIEETVKTYGRLDAAFNNAGVMMRSVDTAHLPEEEYDRIFAINMKGVWLCMKYQINQMLKQGSGAIVNNSSIGGLVAGPGRSAYHAAKHGVLGLTKSAAVEYAPSGIKINAVCPGTIRTPMVNDMFAVGDLSEQQSREATPIKRLGKPEEVADAVLWLFGPESSFVIGQAISVDGGVSII